MIEVMRDPCGQQLTECHNAELRVSPATLEVRVRQSQRREFAEAFPGERRKLVEQAGQRSAL